MLRCSYIFRLVATGKHKFSVFILIYLTSSQWCQFAVQNLNVSPLSSQEHIVLHSGWHSLHKNLYRAAITYLSS